MYHNWSAWATKHFHLHGRRAKGRTNDVIGCGVVAATGELFFTKNGELMSPSNWNLPKYQANGVSQLYYPTVSLLGCGDAAVWNLGVKSFVFDLKQFMADLNADDGGEECNK